MSRNRRLPACHLPRAAVSGPVCYSLYPWSRPVGPLQTNRFGGSTVPFNTDRRTSRERVVCCPAINGPRFSVPVGQTGSPPHAAIGALHRSRGLIRIGFGVRKSISRVISATRPGFCCPPDCLTLSHPKGGRGRRAAVPIRLASACLLLWPQEWGTGGIGAPGLRHHRRRRRQLGARSVTRAASPLIIVLLVPGCRGDDGSFFSGIVRVGTSTNRSDVELYPGFSLRDVGARIPSTAKILIRRYAKR
jgi:hypothetical protein